MPKSMEEKRQWQREYRARCKAENTCQICGRPSDGKVHCPGCRDKTKQEKAQRIAAGMCGSCGKRQIAPTSKGSCLHCLQYGKNCRKRYQADNKCAHCGKGIPEHGSVQCEDCLCKHREMIKAVRLECIAGYGGCCACCGTTVREFLQLDHVNNDGFLHRRNKEVKGTGIYFWAKKNNYPKTLQLLCANCHNAKSWYGVCPHKMHGGRDVQLEGQHPDNHGS